MRLIDADEAVKTLKRKASEQIRSENYREGEEYAIAASVLSREGLFAHLTGKDVNEQFRELEKERDELKEALGLPFVMCKDCEHYQKSLYPYEETGFRGICEVIQNIMDGYYHGMEYRDPWDYCSRGERRTCNATD